MQFFSFFRSFTHLKITHLKIFLNVKMGEADFHAELAEAHFYGGVIFFPQWSEFYKY